MHSGLDKRQEHEPADKDRQMDRQTEIAVGIVGATANKGIREQEFEQEPAPSLQTTTNIITCLYIYILFCNYCLDFLEY